MTYTNDISTELLRFFAGFLEGNHTTEPMSFSLLFILFVGQALPIASIWLGQKWGAYLRTAEKEVKR
jgi:hypothetical protein